MFTFLARRRQLIIRLFQIFYLAFPVLWLIGAPHIYSQTSNYSDYYRLGILAGKTAIVFFIIVLLPGMGRRFGIRHPLLNLIMLFRRYLGITVYMFVATHFLFVGLSSLLAYPLLRLPPYLLFGLFALLFLTPMVLTSNDLAVRQLGSWWARIHQLIYVIAWLIFGHQILQNLGFWSLLIGSAAILETISLLYRQLKNKLPYQTKL